MRASLWARAIPALAGLLLVSASPRPRAPARPEAIVSLSPSVTEILYGVGAFERVVAVSSYCDFPPETESLPKVGGWTNTNLEQVVSLRPDIVILTDAQAPLVEDRLQQLGLRTLAVGSQSLDDVFEAIGAIGAAVGNASEAEALTSDIRERLTRVEEATRGRPRPRVLAVVDRLPGTLRDIYVATRGSFVTELVEIAGGDPITPEASHNYAQINTEAIVAQDPEVILDMVQAIANPVTLIPTSEALMEDPLAIWREIGELKAVRDGRVYTLQDKKLIHPSYFVAETAERIARLLHPEAFAGEEKK